MPVAFFIGGFCVYFLLAKLVDCATRYRKDNSMLNVFGTLLLAIPLASIAAAAIACACALPWLTASLLAVAGTLLFPALVVLALFLYSIMLAR